MIDLYGTGSPNVEKIFIALEETSLPYMAHAVDVFAGKQFEPSFVALNPNAKLPVIVDGEGPGGRPYTCFESGAILLYLADKTHSLLPSEKASRYDAVQWLMTQMSTVGPMSGQLVHFIRFAPPGNEYSYERYLSQVYRVAQIIDGRLNGNEYLAGKEYSVADIATFPWLRRLRNIIGAERAASLTSVTRWAETIKARPAVGKAIQAFDALSAPLTAWNAATPDNIDRFTSRGRYSAGTSANR